MKDVQLPPPWPPRESQKSYKGLATWAAVSIGAIVIAATIGGILVAVALLLGYNGHM